MVEIWEVGSSWWSVLGLLVDICGFTILAVDLLPGYRVSRLNLKLMECDRQANIVIIYLQGLGGNPRETLRAITSHPKAGAGRLTGTHLVILEHLRRHNELAAEIGRQVGHADGPDLGSEIDLEDQFETRRRELEQGISNLAYVLDRVPRPPINIAIFLVVSGFFLQIIGALPNG